jgi:hypothetical protein
MFPHFGALQSCCRHRSSLSRQHAFGAALSAQRDLGADPGSLMVLSNLACNLKKPPKF